MARRQDLSDASNVLLRKPNVGNLFVTGAAAPTASAIGFAPGCIYVNTAGSIGSFVYVNTGTAASATWTNIL